MASASREQTETLTALNPKTEPILLLLQTGAWKEELLGEVMWTSAWVRELCWLRVIQSGWAVHLSSSANWMDASLSHSFSSSPVPGVYPSYLCLEPFRNLFNSIEVNWWLWSWCDVNRQAGAWHSEKETGHAFVSQAHRPKRSYGSYPVLLLWAL